MSTVTQGYQQAAATAANLDATMEKMKDKPSVQTVDGGNNQFAAGGGSDQTRSATGIPGYYHTQDSPADTLMRYRAIAAGVPGVSANLYPATGANSIPTATALKGFNVDLTQKDMQFFEKLRQEELQVEFDTWIATKFNLSDPLIARWVQQMYPSYWERRQRVIDDQITKEARAAKIRLRGVQDLDDVKFLYAVDKGYMDLPGTPAYMWNAVGAGGQGLGARFRAGVFSVIGTNHENKIKRAGLGGPPFSAAFAPTTSGNAPDFASRTNPLA